MKKSFKRYLALIAAGMMALSMASCSDITGKLTGLFGEDSEESSTLEDTYEPIILKEVSQAKNVILMIGDGMGPQQIKAGEIFKGERLCMQDFPYKTFVETRSASNEITDSAAAATALATGTRTTNGVVGQSPTGEELTTIVDIAHSLGKRTGVIATEEIHGATPMGFSAHASSRELESDLIKSAISSSNVDLFASSVFKTAYQTAFEEAGYTKIEKVDDISESTADKVFGSYQIRAAAESMSSAFSKVAFDRVVTEALEYLSQDEDGFFLMAEGSHIDHGGHGNDIAYMLDELLAFDDGVRAALEWAKDRDDTVIIVTADHETGGLTLKEDATQEQMREVYVYKMANNCYSWGTKGHTSTDVMCYINGADIDFKQYSFGTNGRIKNTDVFEIMKTLLEG